MLLGLLFLICGIGSLLWVFNLKKESMQKSL